MRNGSVCHLAILRGRIDAIVSGSSLYTVTIKISELPAAKWNNLRNACTGKISSLLELLKGKFSGEVMRIVTDSKTGLFPLPGEISLSCTCPDWASMCKHVAAVLYGVGARLDHQPELLFRLRGVEHDELISADAMASLDASVKAPASSRRKMKGDLSSVFGIELEEETSLKPAKVAAVRKSRKTLAVKASGPESKDSGKRALKRAATKSMKKAVTKAVKKPIKKAKATKKGDKAKPSVSGR